MQSLCDPYPGQHLQQCISISAAEWSGDSCGAGASLRKSLADLGADGGLLALTTSPHFLSSAGRGYFELGTLEISSAHSILPSEAKSCKQTWCSHESKICQGSYTSFGFFYCFLFYKASEKLALVKALCILPWILGGGKVLCVSENVDYWVINLELYQNAPSKASQVQSPSPGPHQEFIEAMTELSITVSLLSISAFLIRLSWIIRGFIYFNRHLLDSWKESLATKEQELNIIWLISHCRESQTEQREERLRKFVQRTSVIPCRKQAFSRGSQHFFPNLSRLALIIAAFFFLLSHMLTFSALMMWVRKWPFTFIFEIYSWITLTKNSSFAYSCFHWRP